MCTCFKTAKNYSRADLFDMSKYVLTSISDKSTTNKFKKYRAQSLYNGHNDGCKYGRATELHIFTNLFNVDKLKLYNGYIYIEKTEDKGITELFEKVFGPIDEYFNEKINVKKNKDMTVYKIMQSNDGIKHISLDNLVYEPIIRNNCIKIGVNLSDSGIRFRLMDSAKVHFVVNTFDDLIKILSEKSDYSVSLVIRVNDMEIDKIDRPFVNGTKKCSVTLSCCTAMIGKKTAKNINEKKLCEESSMDNLFTLEI